VSRVSPDTIAAVLEELIPIADPHVLERRFCRDVATACGFDRVMLSRVDADTWRPWTVAFAREPDRDRHFATHLHGARIPFADTPAEDRARRELAPAIHAVGDTAPPPLVDRVRTYVVTPLVGSGGFYGLVHADHGRGGGEVTLNDRDALWVLADGFTRRYERTLLTERIRSQHALLRRALETTERNADRLAATPVGLDDVLSVRAIPAPIETALPTILSPRERDVAALVARGATNAQIARELFIVEGTVKTHVKNVMRKLGATTRAEAIAKILADDRRRR
jgi:DNA-binding CsgD family transcriptional regulator